MKKILNLGYAPKRKAKKTNGFNTSDWLEILLGLASSAQSDVIKTIAKMSDVSSTSENSIYSSQNIEHLYPHEVPVAFAEFLRVLKPDGFFVVTCPDLQSVCKLIADDKLTDPAYTSPAGPIAPLDILYGLRSSMARGNLYMAHRCGFTKKVLTSTLQAAGFKSIAAMSRGYPYFDLWAVASKKEISEDQMKSLAIEHITPV